ncbi:glycosyltransferase [Agromyces protaetiae]|uniref:Glycosyltransferase n=1 Tax=Agromyces protaetiae TaxID=2509455 RepID=A0A4V0YHG1_9MICO|nr:glycosyltransferase [Agromyces protaetiae]QAY74591.1 glycosyltransferase [Agromyces protaetiae]
MTFDSTSPRGRVLVVLACAFEPAEMDRLVRSASGSSLIDVDFAELAPGGSVAEAVNAATTGGDIDAVAVVTAPGEFVRLELERALVLVSSEGGPVAVYGDTFVGHDGVLLQRPQPDPERLRCQYYFGPVVVWSARALAGIGGFRTDVPGAEAHEAALRAGRERLEIVNLRGGLFRTGSDAILLDDVALESVRRVLEEDLAATGGGVVLEVSADGVHRTRRLVVGEPLVSIVIPTRGIWSGTRDGKPHGFVVEAVRSIVERSTYRNFELVIVIDHVAEPAVVDELRALAGDRLVLVDWNAPFNFSSKVNLGAVHARGEYLLLLNDDVEVISPDWLEAMLSLAQLDGAGMVGAMLYYEDDTIQHAGHAYYNGDASHIGLDVPRGEAGPLGGFRVEREVAGVTAACALMPTAVYHEVGGLSDLLPGAFNDVDLCMKTTWLGHRIYWTPRAELYHFESRTRDASVRAFEVEVAWGRWGFRMHQPEFWPYPLDRQPS